MTVLPGVIIMVIVLVLIFRANKKKLNSGERCNICGHKYQGINLECECTNWGQRIPRD